MEVFEQLLEDYAQRAGIMPSAFYEKIMAGLVYWEDLDLKKLELDIEIEKNNRINKTEGMQYILSQLCQLTIEDSLTGLYNRRYFNQAMKNEIERNYRDNRSLALAIIDIDHFKNVNDTWGHDVGDKVLKDVANIMKNNVRQSDTISRIGGEEFAVIMPNIRHHLAKEVMERLRADIENAIIPVDNTELQVTISIGTAVSEPKQIITVDEFYNLSDQALYQAKNSGRNKVVIHGASVSPQLSTTEREALMQ